MSRTDPAKRVGHWLRAVAVALGVFASGGVMAGIDVVMSGRACNTFVAARHTDARVVSPLEGGCNLDALAASVASHIRILGTYRAPP